jgi:hypothetical protein
MWKTSDGFAGPKAGDDDRGWKDDKEYGKQRTLVFRSRSDGSIASILHFSREIQNVPVGQNVS